MSNTIFPYFLYVHYHDLIYLDFFQRDYSYNLHLIQFNHFHKFHLRLVALLKSCYSFFNYVIFTITRGVNLIFFQVILKVQMHYCTIYPKHYENYDYLLINYHIPCASLEILNMQRYDYFLFPQMVLKMIFYQYQVKNFINQLTYDDFWKIGS